MSCSSSTSWNFGVPQQYEDYQIKQIRVFDRLAQNIGLKLLDGRHCFCVIKLNDCWNTQYKLEAGMNQKTGTMGVGYQLYVPDKKVHQQLITEACLKQYISFKRLGNAIKNWYEGGQYDPVENNCYHVAERIFQFLKFDKNAQLIKKKRRRITQNGIGNTYGIAMGIALGISGVCVGFLTNNWTPLIKIAKDSNKIIASGKSLGICVTKLFEF